MQLNGLKRVSPKQNQRAEMNHDDMLTRLRDALRGRMVSS